MLRCIQAAACDVAYGAAVAVLRTRSDGCGGLEAEIAQALLGALAKGLLGLGRIDGGQANLDLLVRTRFAAACGKGVSIRDANDEAEGSGNEQGGSLPKKNAHPSGFGWRGLFAF